MTLSVMRCARDKLVSHQAEYFDIDIAALTGRLDKMLTASKPEFFKLIAGNRNFQTPDSGGS